MSSARRDHSLFDADLTGRSFDSHLTWRLLRYLAPYRRLLLLCAAAVMVSSLMAVLMPVVLSRVVIDGVLYPREDGVAAPDFGMVEAARWLGIETDLPPLAVSVLMYAALTVAWGVASHVQRMFLARASLAALRDLRHDLFEHLERLSTSFFDRVAVGRVMTRVTNDVEVLLELLWGLGMLVGEIVPFFLALVLIFSADPALAGLMLLSIPIVGVATWLFRRATRVVYRKVRQSVSQLNQNLQENLAGISVVQTHTREDRNLDRYREINQDNRSDENHAINLEVTYQGFVDSLTGIALAAILWFGGRQVLGEVITLGTLVLFARYTDLLFRPIIAVGEQYNVLYRAMASSERIFQLLDWEERVKEPEHPKTLPERLVGGVEFRNLTFGYQDGPTIVHDLSFRIEPGEKVAVVGATGAGKTTLIRLLARFYDFEKGEILVDGIDVRSLRARDLRARLGIVLQDFHVFAGTVRDNIRLGDASIDDAAVEEAARLVQADDFIRRLPQGYDTSLAERGANLSHGQRQLLSFARVLATDPEILILDEATASIDPETEERIRRALEKITAGRTALLIAHRLLTVQEADRIVVMQNGRIVEIGSHEELYASGGLYRTIYELQFRQADAA